MYRRARQPDRETTDLLREGWSLLPYKQRRTEESEIVWEKYSVVRVPLRLFVQWVSKPKSSDDQRN